MQVAVKNPSLKNHLAFVPIKIAADHEVNTRLTVKSYGYWGISSLANSKERETAVDFIVWLNVSNKGKEYIHTGFGLIDISSKQYSTSIMGSTMGYIKSGSTVPYIADYANSNIAASLGRLCKKQMSTAKWGESFYNAFADAAENYL